MWPFNPSYPILSVHDAGSETKLSDKESKGRGVYDYIVVGGGTAGCVLASRLSEDSNVSVLLVERGGASQSWESRVPLLSSDYRRKKAPAMLWDAAPLSNINNRVVDMLSGKALGGTSRINSMVYTRGSASEFNRWSRSGRKGWSYDEIEKYFKKSEDFTGRPVPEHHATGGPWPNRSHDYYHFLSTEKCAQAAETLGIPVVSDINSPDAPAIACGRLNVTIDQHAHRCSTFDAFLPLPLALERQDRLKICAGGLVTLLDIESGPQGNKRAVGVFFEEEQSENARTYYARARKDIVLCAGAIASPQLLMLSGIGPAAHLHQLGIKVQKDLEGVGSNLQDHLGVSTIYQIPMSDSFNILHSSPARVVRELVKYIVSGTGLFLSPIAQISIFVRSMLLDNESKIKPHQPADVDSRNPDNIPDIEIMPVAHSTREVEDVEAVDSRVGIFSFLSVILQPRSAGTVRLASADPKVRPRCDLAFLSDPGDYEMMRKAVRLSVKIASTMRARGYNIINYIVPEDNSDTAIDNFIRTNARTTYHYSATCRMAPEDDPRPGVVDDYLRVHGIGRLRVADCSIFPDIIANHLQAPAAMVGEKCADMIKMEAAQ
ncbi:hypothetical protein PLICRDRAFT_118582 [Plicaturopsis crispa FD-325 SS-3]|uniref:Glucose-methanol-choline oxidoreductase N-terminal domain-containing protein n=1 Tax=Plicaturopsis crispa FD-325 SS-3 TaxID=944288 RepID=A0A0C9SKQ2_PLICR|nr:hypothetical protein PLICRDRAFT_118582 [Plicaturopsis crispa FD-325 SS-3]